MMLLTKAIQSRLPPIGSQQDRRPEDIEIIVKFFDPAGSWTWYTIEGESRPDGDWEFFGLVRGFEAELGPFMLSELLHAKDGLRGLQALPIERDRHFGRHTLAEALAQHI